MGRGAGQIVPLFGPRSAVEEVGYLGTFWFGAEALAHGWRLGRSEIVEDYGGNARHGSRMIERRIAVMLGGRLAPEGSSYDLALADGSRLEVRCFTSGVSFVPSHSLGAGRHVSAEAFDGKLKAVNAFVLCDTSAFPRIECWFVPVDAVRLWRQAGLLGKRGRMSAAKFRRIAGDAPPVQLASGLHNGGMGAKEQGSASALRVGVSLESPWEKARKLAAPISSDVFAALARIKTDALLATEGVEVDSSATVAAASLILDALATADLHTLASERLHCDVVQF